MPGYKEKKKRLRELVKQKEEERIKKIQEEGYQFQHVDAFRVREKEFKYYKHRKTDYSKVLDINQLKKIQVDGVQVYQIEKPQGAYLVKNFISKKQQFQVGFEAMNDFIRKPYRTNLDGTNGLYLEEEKKEEEKEQNIIKTEQKMQEKQQKQQKKEEKIEKEQEVKEQNIQQNKGYFFNEKIRMANLGYQYDWPHRCYPKTQVPIPQTIQSLTKKAQLLYQKLSNNNLDYHGEAVIVNYYKPRQYMIGHLDDGQQDQINPIFSFNFGLTAIFLLGFPDKNIQPVAIKLEAGDLMIMSGFSRICYHGVPRIVEDSWKEYEMNEEMGYIAQQINKQMNEPYRINGFKQVTQYFKTHRLNLNIRQVWVRKEQLQKEQLQKTEKEEQQQQK